MAGVDEGLRPVSRKYSKTCWVTFAQGPAASRLGPSGEKLSRTIIHVSRLDEHGGLVLVVAEEAVCTEEEQ